MRAPSAACFELPWRHSRALEQFGQSLARRPAKASSTLCTWLFDASETSIVDGSPATAGQECTAMMNRFTIAFLLLLVSSCRSSPAVQEPQEEQEPQRTGAYSEVPSTDEDVVAAAKQALELLRVRANDDSLTLRAIVHAEQQVVAGLNTKLTLQLSSATGEQRVTVVVYRNLRDEYVLTSVE